jgi:hypothetical protein
MNMTAADASAEGQVDRAADEAVEIGLATVVSTLRCNGGQDA